MNYFENFVIGRKIKFEQKTNNEVTLTSILITKKMFSVYQKHLGIISKGPIKVTGVCFREKNFAPQMKFFPPKCMPRQYYQTVILLFKSLICCFKS